MALPELHPLSELQLSSFTSSVGQSAIPGYIRAPFRCKVLKVGSLLKAAISTADATITTNIISGATTTAITGGAFTITQSGSAAGDHDNAIPTAANIANEDEIISFVSTGSSGSAIGCDFYAVVRRV